MARTQGVTVWFAITTLVVDLLSLPDLSAADMPTLRMIVGGGAAMPEALARQLRDLTGLTFVEGYGLTETISQSHFNPMNRPKLHCLGLPVFDVDSRVVDPESGQEVPQGEAGEIGAGRSCSGATGTARRRRRRRFWSWAASAISVPGIWAIRESGLCR
ncbi:hypothetical protein DESA109040_00455 [Deinococcus saxicola]|uniref:AMP-binding protein n=1 Tax=Deinococcus saxicola TaxID=249406 RepID=UPI0039EEF2F4